MAAASTVELPALLATLAATLVGAKALGALAQRLGQPSVLGELIAGILLGGSVLGVLDPDVPAIHALSEIGVLVLLFEIGLHTDLRSLASTERPQLIAGVARALKVEKIGMQIRCVHQVA